MSLTSGPINESEQAGEKLADHVGQQAVPQIVQIIDALFQRLWNTRITIDIGKWDTH